MSKEPSSVDSASLEEQLSAYLDGELDDEATRQIEQRLACDPQIRKTLQDLERTWQILDTLDEAEVDESFTRSTLEMVAVAAEEDVQRQAAEAPRLRRRRVLVALTWLAGAAAVGFMAVALGWPNPNRQLLEDLPVVERLEQYRQIGDFEFLDALYREGMFVEEGNDES